MRVILGFEAKTMENLLREMEQGHSGSGKGEPGAETTLSRPQGPERAADRKPLDDDKETHAYEETDGTTQHVLLAGRSQAP
jgi:hypothetical protein